MSISEKQLAANRANAQKSTGPVTPEGIAVAAHNATRHGLYSRDAILNSPHIKEDPVEFDQLIESLKEELRPDTPLQEILIRKIANCLWRCRRATLAETALVNHQLNHTAEEFPPQEASDVTVIYDPNLSNEQNEYLKNKIGLRLIPNESYLDNILKYEMRLDRQLARACEFYFSLKQRGRAACREKSKIRPKKMEGTNPFSATDIDPNPAANDELTIIEFGG